MYEGLTQVAISSFYFENQPTLFESVRRGHERKTYPNKPLQHAHTSDRLWHVSCTVYINVLEILNKVVSVKSL